jgi:hypothetical protein
MIEKFNEELIVMLILWACRVAPQLVLETICTHKPGAQVGHFDFIR